MSQSRFNPKLNSALSHFLIVFLVLSILPKGAVEKNHLSSSPFTKKVLPR